MAPFPHITLEQWRALLAVVEAGGYAQAAKALHKSQSAVTYAVQQIEERLGLKVFGRWSTRPCCSSAVRAAWPRTGSRSFGWRSR